MTLFLSTLILATLFLIVGIAFSFSAFEKLAFKFLRSKLASYILIGISGAWFLWILYNLTEADFGQYKFILMAVFGGAGLLSFKYLPDFLSVRGLAILMLLSIREFLNSAYMVDASFKFPFVLDCYLLVVVFIYFGCLPYRMRDFFEWMYEKDIRLKIFVIALFLEALTLFGAALTY